MAICGREVECYSRVVGYYRPVKDYNIGKKEEMKERVEFTNGQLKRNEVVASAIKQTEAKALGIFD